MTDAIAAHIIECATKNDEKAKAAAAAEAFDVTPEGIILKGEICLERGQMIPGTMKDVTTPVISAVVSMLGEVGNELTVTMSDGSYAKLKLEKDAQGGSSLKTTPILLH